ncbi:phage holin family protein [Gymnodinialimonas ceratoperidinii]|uniref:Phage holin family protein n=1 Tax=Gymnodinialimonas ceratoperidinii TaxID=2856823 RepID=A0A8F6Y9M5_9RHOB|nr:phage holin family protein [Gymnodinialimonas ceratoperidinii]QXT39099.1 phage holin family protein [Gymnodinialimonas ceratoperidinii]
MSAPQTNISASAHLLTEIVNQIGRILRKEAALAKAEVGENLSRAGAGIGMLVGAALLGLVALFAFAGAAVAALVSLAGWPVYWAALAVGGVLVLIAIILAMKGKNDLKPERLMPDRSISNVKRDVAAVKESINA